MDAKGNEVWVPGAKPTMMVEGKQIRTSCGIKDRLRAAKSKSEIEKLLKELKTWQHSSAKTVRQCETIAAKRLKEVSA